MSLNDSTSLVLGELQGKGDYYTKLCVIERKRLVDLEDATTHITSEIKKYKILAKKAAVGVMNTHSLAPNPPFSKADGNDVARQAAQVTKKVLNVMEIKLNKLLQRKSEIINHNKSLKGEIDHHRRLRMMTDTTHKKFENILGETKSSIEIRLNESTLVLEERERIIEKKVSILYKGDMLC